MPTEQQPFSKRYGHKADIPEITIREDAPEDFRYALLQLAHTEMAIRPTTLRDIVCQVLRKRPDPDNWSEYPNIWGEVEGLVYNCAWFYVYDIAEAIFRHLSLQIISPPPGILAVPAIPSPSSAVYQQRLNDYLIEAGIGWQMINGLLQTRGDEAFETNIRNATAILLQASLPTATSELQEAIRDLSRRPDPDLSGAITHAMGALECVAKEVAGDSKLTLGEAIKKRADMFPKPLDSAVAQVWGYASQVARHVHEGRVIEREEVEFVVGLAAVATTYLAKKFMAPKRLPNGGLTF